MTEQVIHEGKTRLSITKDGNWIEPIQIKVARSLRRELAKGTFSLDSKEQGPQLLGTIKHAGKEITFRSSLGVGETIQGKEIKTILFNKVPTAAQGYKSEAMVYFKYIVC